MNLPQSKYPKTKELWFLDIILNEISNETLVSVNAIKKADRHQYLVKIRCMYFALGKTYIKTGIKKISQRINKSHSTLLKSIEDMGDLYFTDHHIRNTYKRIMTVLEEKRRLMELELNTKKEFVGDSFRCPICNGTEVQVLALINLNTKAITRLPNQKVTCAKCNIEIQPIKSTITETVNI